MEVLAKASGKAEQTDKCFVFSNLCLCLITSDCTQLPFTSILTHPLHLYLIVFLHLFSIDIDFSFAKPARFYPNLVATFSF